MNREWTEEELDILRRDREAKVPVPVTAAKLNRPVPATYLRARMIGTQVQTHQAWDAATAAKLRELVNADPPMTDKQIAAELGRTVTQVRWKLKDLDLIGVRDLSKLAKAVAPSAARPKDVPHTKPAATPAPSRAPSPQPARASAPRPAEKPLNVAPIIDVQTLLNVAIRRLERNLQEHLKAKIADMDSGMMQAAMAAIAEKRSIDERLANLSDRSLYIEVKRKPERTEEPKPQRAKPRGQESQPTTRKPAVRPMVPSVSVASAAPASTPRSIAPEPPKIVVLDTPIPMRPTMQEIGPAQTSGRGGWKSVRRDPARVAAQARGKATNRADAVDLAQAAQAAIEQFIAQRGITKTEAVASQSLVTRLQARGYIVVREGEGWIIDQRHRVADEAELASFAKARGIKLDIAA